MKICFLISALSSGGAERTIAYLANYMESNKIEVDVVTYSNKPLFYTLNDQVKHISIFNKEASKISIKRFLNIFTKLRNFKSYIKENRPDVVCCLLYPAISYAVWGGRKKYHYKIVSSERSNPEFLKSKLKIAIRNSNFNKSDGVIYQTHKAEEFYKSIVKTKSTVIPNAVGNPYIDLIDYGAIVRKKKISAIGSLKDEKDYFTLIKAFKIVYEKHSDFILEIFGSGYLQNQLNNFVNKLHLENNVIFKGNDKEAIIKIADSACFVLSSISEGMPNALLEAMAARIPCISTNCNNGPAELIENGVNGLLVPIKNELAMADAIITMIEEKEFAEKCAENASKIKEAYSVNCIAKRYLEFIAEVFEDD